MSDFEPDEYDPIQAHMPGPRQKTYAVGHTKDFISFGMTHGPWPTLREALNTVPSPPEEGETVCLIRFDTDGTDTVLYLWDEDRYVWKKRSQQ